MLYVTEDVFPDTETLSFHGAGYTSDQLSFTGVALQTRTLKDGDYTPLDNLSPADQKTFETFNRPPYVQGDCGSIPFLNIGGKFINLGASYDVAVLEGKSRAEIAAALAARTTRSRRRSTGPRTSSPRRSAKPPRGSRRRCAPHRG